MFKMSRRSIRPTKKPALGLLMPALAGSIYAIMIFFGWTFSYGRYATGIEASLAAALRDDQSLGNNAVVGRRIADLESLGMIVCVSISNPQIGEFYSTAFRPECRRYSILGKLSAAHQSRTVIGVNGDLYTLAFRVPAKTVDVIGWLVALLSGLFGIVLTSYSAREKWAAMERESTANKRKSEIAKQVSHDIRSPASALQVAAEQLPNDLLVQKELIIHATDRIKQIANDLLRDSRQGGPGGEQSEMADLMPLNVVLKGVRAAVEEKCLEFPERARDLVFLEPKDLDSLSGLAVSWTPAEANRTLSNLMNNAIEASEAGSPVSVGMSLDPVGCLRLIIDDRGIGMSDEQLAEIEAGAIVSRKANGTGLGVRSARQSVEGANGRFRVQSKLGRGTQVMAEFHTFPLTASERSSR
jgi:signal transduction histidine kinase